MNVTSNKLFNYIRCRRFAALHDANSETNPYKHDQYYLKNYSKFKDIFLGLNYRDSMSYDKNLELTYDFHHDFTLSGYYDFIFDERDIYILVTESSKEFLKLQFKLNNQVHQLFKKNDGGHFQMITDIEDSENYHLRVKKMMGLHETTGRVIFRYAFLKYLYQSVFPNKDFNMYVILLNEDYVHNGMGFDHQLYHSFDFSNLQGLDNRVEIALFRMINHIELNDFTPCELVKNACMNGKELACKFVGFCYGHLPDKNSILDYFDSHLGFKEPLKQTHLHHNTYELLNNGYIKMDDIPLDWLSHKNRLMQRYCLDNDSQHIHKEKLALMMDGIQYPITYLDMSLMPTIIPKFKGERPFELLGFQYSIYYQNKPKDDLMIDGQDMINSFKETRTDTRTQFAERFANHLLKYDGSILVYNKPKLVSVFESIKVVFPSLKGKFDMVIDRLIDVLDILMIDSKYLRQFKQSDFDLSTYNFYDNRLSGSYARNRLATVFDLQAMNNLPIHDDETEYKTYRLFNDFSETEKEKSKSQMIEYSQHKAYLLYKIIHQINQWL
ncbi:MAG TPA: DUF2779 domain-containing protein [Candidatus Izemoplasmatales bacterium]|nr:DUF2779 domain-containing protein [Candidatus Izemoplasmatales bacterium]